MDASALQMELPNPQTPLAFIAPETAKWFEITRYVIVGTLGMYLWDILTNLKGDIRLLTKYRITFPTVAYFLARISALVFVLNAAIFITAKVGNCRQMDLAETISFSISVSSTAFLFLLRILAIFSEYRLISFLFIFLWVATVGCSITTPVSVSAAQIGTTQFCTRTDVKSYGVVALIMSSVYDTLVFLFISCRLLQATSSKMTFTGRVKSFFTPTDLPSFSRALLQNGQQYYLIAVGINIIAMGVVLSPGSFPDIARVLFIVPNAALSNAMACRVHRDLKFGRTQKSLASVINTTHIQFSAHSEIATRVRSDSDASSWETEEGEVMDIGLHTHGTRPIPLDLEHGYISGEVGTGSKAHAMVPLAAEVPVHVSIFARFSMQSFANTTRGESESPRRKVTRSSSHGPY